MFQSVKRQPSQLLKTTLSLFACLLVTGSCQLTHEEPKLFSVQLEESQKEVSLLQAMDDLPRYFGRRTTPLAYPESFSFPRSFEYSMNLGTVTNFSNPSKSKVFEGSQTAIFDAVHNRVRIERETRVFHETDLEVQVYDFDKMMLLISDPSKRMCLKFKIADISPVSMVPREHDQIFIADAIQGLWTQFKDSQEEIAQSKEQAGVQEKDRSSSSLTQYLGEYTVLQQSSLGEKLSSESLHIFSNAYSFISLEETYLSRGGSSGAHTLYLWRHITVEADEDSDKQYQSSHKDNSIWQLAGVVTKHQGSKPSYTADLGNSFKTLDNATLNSSDYEMKFYQKECSEYLDDYMLIDGTTLVKKVGAYAVSNQ